jgi:hypothetical protein
VEAMTETSPVADNTQDSKQHVRPYTPSWLDRFTDWIEGLPGRSWIAYLILFLLLGLQNQIAAWIFGTLPVGEFDIYLFLYHLFTFEILFFSKFLDKDAERALKEFRPVLDSPDDVFSRILFEFTNLPARPVFVLTILGGLFGSYYAYSLEINIMKEFQLTFYTAYGFIAFAIPMSLMVIFCYRIVRQLQNVSRLTSTIPKIDLFNLDPIYALSSHTAKTGLIFLFLIYTNIWVNPESIQLPTAIISITVISILSFLAFIVPLMGINRRLVKEKRGMRREVNHRLKMAFVQADRDFNNLELGEMDELEKTVAIFERQKEFVEKLPTWPWQPATLRGFLSAVTLPLIIWIVQEIVKSTLRF